jgi:hypothetical protein
VCCGYAMVGYELLRILRCKGVCLTWLQERDLPVVKRIVGKSVVHCIITRSFMMQLEDACFVVAVSTGPVSRMQCGYYRAFMERSVKET